MMTPHDIQTLFSIAQRWWLFDTGLSCIVATQQGSVAMPRITKSELNQVHPRLWSSLEAVMTTCARRFGKGQYTIGLVGNLLRGQLALLQYPERKISISEQRVHVANLVSLYWPDPGMDPTVNFLGSSISVAAAADGTSFPIEHVTLSFTQGVPTPCTWLDRHYPGWHARYQAGVALGYTPEELAAAVEMVVPNTQDVPITLPSTDLTSTYE